jgi:hypothetical protein
MDQSLIVVCDQKSMMFGEDLYRSSVYGICDIAEVMGSDQFEVREALLAIGGEMDWPSFLSEQDIRNAIESAPNYGRHYDCNEEECIEKAVKEMLKVKRDVFCSFSFC